VPGSAIRLLVEPAHLADVELIAPLFDAYRRFYGAASDLAAARDFLVARLSCGESVILMAIAESEEGDRDSVAGFAQLYPSFSSLALQRSMILNDLYVVPDKRRLGVGRRLVRESIEYALRAGAARVELATELVNANALALYESEGFERETGFVHLRRATIAIRPLSRPDVGRLMNSFSTISKPSSPSSAASSSGGYES
jgi:GNAT superfamily N-acetyltransferase